MIRFAFAALLAALPASSFADNGGIPLSYGERPFFFFF